ncbi:EP300-interacting inhibitor of differentiation 3-like [Sitophilus oryzae]|uniref:Non-structural maintenance of chromosomes element 4 n=1 Tax=Sitophilus oryzae TaxID=7048 RepID=A0A6J2YFL0_SITOR|nr:EP300-interacting inhibitor of differentiation 3-like [Sitophilus oryzae]
MEIYDQENIVRKRSVLERKLYYRDLLNKAETIKESDTLGIQTVSDIGDILSQANILNSEVDIEERVGNADETLLDCLVVSSASGILMKWIEAVDVFAATYDSTEFVGKIISHVKQDDNDGMKAEDILKLLDHAREIIPNVPKYNSIYGSYNLDNLPERKEKVKKQRAPKERLEKKEPEKIVNLDKEEEGIEEIVKFLFEVLVEAYSKNNESPVNYYDYIIDTDSYSKTIENMFYFAFLVRDGKAHFDLDNSGTPLIRPMSKKELKLFRDKGGKNTQIISCINMDLYNKYNKEGLLQKHRKKHKLSQK